MCRLVGSVFTWVDDLNEGNSDLSAPRVIGEHKASYRMVVVSIGGSSLWGSGHRAETLFDISSQAVRVPREIRRWRHAGQFGCVSTNK